jgi:putative RecB family exonuclease
MSETLAQPAHAAPDTALQAISLADATAEDTHFDLAPAGAGADAGSAGSASEVGSAGSASDAAPAGSPPDAAGARAASVGATSANASPTDAPVAVASAEEAGDDEAAAEESAGEEHITGPSLSPSRAGDFMTCPLLYRFRVVDRLPEAPSPAAARGTLVHAVLERLFDEPAADRTPAAARGLLLPQWDRLAAAEPALASLFEDEAERVAWLDEAASMLDRYFTLEDPRRIEPSYREMSVRAMLESGLTLRGYIDRLDIAPTGEIRIVDYKTGTAPREEYEARALFQMKFYAVVLWRTRGMIPRLLQLIYLGNGEIVRYAPDEADLLATERKINALWQAIDRARTSGDWRPRQSRLCDWCSFQALCPVYGGTPPPLPADVGSAEPTSVESATSPPPAASPPAASLPPASPPAASPPAASPPAATPPAPAHSATLAASLPTDGSPEQRTDEI